jgi:hypothetical protein
MDKSVKDTLKSPTIMGLIIFTGLILIGSAIYTWVEKNANAAGTSLSAVGCIFISGLIYFYLKEKASSVVAASLVSSLTSSSSP